MRQEVFQVDAFTKKPFAGNPAVVCLMPAPADEAWMRSVASEMNLSETAFLYKQDKGYNLRWFNPETEVDLCGHATLASAHVLWEMGEVPGDQKVRFYTRSGVLTASREGDWIELDFPAIPEEPVQTPIELEAALGVKPIYVGKSRFDYLVEVATEDEVRRTAPDFGLLARLPSRGVILTSLAASGRFDFVSRFFAPAAGIDEDPVAGSAHCTLGPFWQSRLGKAEFLAYQASRRGGELKVRVGGDRVLLGGQAVTVLRGTLEFPAPSKCQSHR